MTILEKSSDFQASFKNLLGLTTKLRDLLFMLLQIMIAVALRGHRFDVLCRVERRVQHILGQLLAGLAELTQRHLISHRGATRSTHEASPKKTTGSRRLAGAIVAKKVNGCRAETC